MGVGGSWGKWGWGMSEVRWGKWVGGGVGGNE